jgi:integrase
MASITKKSDGKYLIRVSRGTGKRRSYINETFDGTLAEARRHARELEDTIDERGSSIDARKSFEIYFEKWLQLVARGLAPRTLDGYEGYIRRYALEPLGPLKLYQIGTDKIQDVITSVDKAPNTVRNLHAALRACFSYAVRRKAIRHNPCKGVEVPSKPDADIVTLSLHEAGVFTEICEQMPNGIIFQFALETGMRPEEYLAIRWRDLTLVGDAEAFLQKAVQFNRSGGGYYFKDLKTKRSRRRVPISPGLRMSLIRHRIAQNEHRMAMKGTWFDHDLVFPNVIGGPYPLNNLTRRFLAPVIDRCGFDKHIHLYSLRHSCATILLELGLNPKVVADRLGSSVNMILSTYSHVLPHIQDDATAKIANVMRMKR